MPSPERDIKSPCLVLTCVVVLGASNKMYLLLTRYLAELLSLPPPLYISLRESRK